MVCASKATISGGVPVGATMPVHSEISMSGMPASAMVGTSGKAGLRLAAVMAERAQLAGLQRAGHRARSAMVISTWPGGDRLHRIAAAAIGDVLELRAGALVEQLRGELEGRGARGIVGELGVGAAVLDQLAHRLGRLLGADRQQQRELGEQRDRREVALPVDRAAWRRPRD